MIDTLLGAVTPHHMQEFLGAYSAGQLLSIKGWPTKFDGLLSWPDVNEILLHHQFDFPRMRLLREGKVLPAESYLKYVPSRRQSGAFRQKLSVDLFNEQLRSGATLVIDDVQELFAPVMKLSTDVELTLRERVQVNAYVAWDSARALDLHWDDHDVLALQLLGKKEWRVYGMTRTHPLTLESPTPPDSSSKPVWEGVLEAGDLLYVPRGWWHHVFPLGEPAIHLTFGIYRRTGIDLMAWFNEKLRSKEVFRQNLPQFASAEAREQHLNRLREEILAQWDEGTLDRFFKENDGTAEPKSYAGLPWSLLSQPADLPEDLKVRLTTPRPIVTTVDSKKETLSFFANNKRWEFAAQAAPILDELDHSSGKSIRELCKAIEKTISAQVVREFLLELLHEGLITAESDGTKTIR